MKTQPIRLVVWALTLAAVSTLAGGAAQPPGGAPLPSPRLAPPNFLLDISGDMINVLVRKPLEKMQPVRDGILDTNVFGTCWTKGEVQAELVPDTKHGVVDIVARGVTCSKTVGIQEPVKIYSTSHIPFEVRKRLRIDGGGLGGYPAHASSRATIFLQKITTLTGEEDTTSTGIGHRQFLEEKKDYEHETARRHERQMANQFEEELKPHLVGAGKALAQGLASAKKLGFSRDQMQFRSSSTHVRLEGVLLSPGLFMAPAPEPVAPFDLALRVHQSLFNEAAEGLLGGKSYTLVQLGQLADTLLGPALGKNKANEDLKKAHKDLTEFLKKNGIEPQTIIFANREPIALSFSNQGIVAVITAKGYKAGGENFQGFKVVVGYQIENWKGKVAGVRKGPVQLQPMGVPSANLKPLPDSEQMFLKMGFETILGERLVLADIDLPAPIRELGPLKAIRADARHGWFMVTWNRLKILE